MSFCFAFKNDAMFDTISTLGSLLQDQVVKASRIINLRLYRSLHRYVLDLLDFHVLKPSTVQYVYKLADRMRSMRTNGASKNRDSWVFFSV